MRPRTIYVLCLLALTLATVPFPAGQRELFALLDDSPAPPQRLTVVGYEREVFGTGWAPTPSGCSTRDVLVAHAYELPGCAALRPAGSENGVPGRTGLEATITDPYTGHPLAIMDVELDHVFPLAAAWDLGAFAWDDVTRRAFANDPANLIVTSRTANQAKSDQLPSQWLPPNRPYQCEYATRLASVAGKYRLALPTPDRRAMARACTWSMAGLLPVH